MDTSAEHDEYQPASAEEEAFSLVDTLTDLSDADLERMCEREAQSEVDSSAYEGIPLDKAAMKAGLLDSYRKLRAERQTAR